MGRNAKGEEREGGHPEDAPIPLQAVKLMYSRSTFELLDISRFALDELGGSFIYQALYLNHGVRIVIVNGVSGELTSNRTALSTLGGGAVYLGSPSSTARLVRVRNQKDK